jgi:hypothetical protein
MSIFKSDLVTDNVSGMGDISERVNLSITDTSKNEKGEKNAPYDLLPLYFEKEKDKWDRLLIAKALFKTGEMTEELRQECMLDRLPATRELACRIDPDVSFAELERTMHL